MTYREEIALNKILFEKNRTTYNLIIDHLVEEDLISDCYSYDRGFVEWRYLVSKLLGEKGLLITETDCELMIPGLVMLLMEENEMVGVKLRVDDDYIAKFYQRSYQMVVDFIDGKIKAPLVWPRLEEENE